MPIDVEISDIQTAITTDRESVAHLVRTALFALGIERATISIALVDNKAIHAVNRRHLGHDWPTDVITFRLSDESDPVLAGELVISAEMAVGCARERGVDWRHELALYLVHGLLHLCGHDDTSDAAAQDMRNREQEILSVLNLPNPFLAPLKPAAGDGWARAGGSDGQPGGLEIASRLVAGEPDRSWEARP